ncbi:hypothetical protein FC18_GL002316 [Lacticaseibacillus sharpeae JCM 1186 = DSM 20505]|uniref:HNH nuclease domain-containing protein n=1 Tax=Lacticaseibacillus sharpeae JCM 1186 = DSM 20505 TaxID=1291052 RepID=A0A0R1ZI03_9LACO|nr:hypothetical protein FC18_GL002316 [Lacticaseibacillus sharpeae JCM 1186 = DSM 20505]
MLDAYVPGHHYFEISEFVHTEFGITFTVSQVHSYVRNHHLLTGFDGRIKKRQVLNAKMQIKPGEHRNPATEFKSGHEPVNKLPIGTTKVKSDGYLWTKVKDTGPMWKRWRQTHVLKWESAHGPRPAGMAITFIDGNKLNVSLDNLMLMTKAEMLQYNRRGLSSADPEINLAALNLAKMVTKAHRVKRREKN